MKLLVIVESFRFTSVSCIDVQPNILAIRDDTYLVEAIECARASRSQGCDDLHERMRFSKSDFQSFITNLQRLEKLT